VKILATDRLYELIDLESFHPSTVSSTLSIDVHADFADIFELRGQRRERRGVRARAHVTKDGIVFGYRGTDGRRRRTTVHVYASGAVAGHSGGSRVAQRLTPERVVLDLTLDRGDPLRLEVVVECEIEDVAASPRASFDQALSTRRAEESAWLASHARITSSNQHLDEWLERSVVDLAMLRSSTAECTLIYAGVPWFAATFGRDAVITALETLTLAPAIAAGTLRRLAALQGTTEAPERDEQPGKIVHEVRHDEMAAAGEVPFGRYYGSVDSTPLFLLLAGAYVRRTGDLALAGELWPAFERALEWITRYGDRDGDGYVEYARETPRGLVNQGWKDSHDSISHRDGRLAEAPIALVEVQGYLYGAYRGLAFIARRLGQRPLAGELLQRAADLQARFHRDFWMEDQGFYALALDGEKRRCEVVSSNPGHCLATGIVPADVARRVAERLLQPDLFCGWGIRTLSAHERRFNPMSYHNGSVWPHDNALVAAGLRRCGAVAEAVAVLRAFFDASVHVEQARLPELFCGFTRAEHTGPVPYPVACRPQAFAAGSAFMMLQAALGLRIDAFRNRLTFDRPRLPDGINEVRLENLRVGMCSVDLSVARPGTVSVVRRDGPLDVVIRK
jgi:glycogen debranching enzyme